MKRIFEKQNGDIKKNRKIRKLYCILEQQGLIKSTSPQVTYDIASACTHNSVLLDFDYIQTWEFNQILPILIKVPLK